MPKGVHDGHRKGSANGNSKLVERDVVAIRSSRAPSRELAEKHGVSERWVRMLRSRQQCWRHV